MADAIKLPEIYELDERDPVVGWEVTDLSSADWAAGKIREAQESMQTIKEHADRLRKQADEWESRQLAPYADQVGFFTGLLRLWADRGGMEGLTKKKSLDLPSGMRIGFRSGSEVVEIEDEEAAIAECKQYQLDDAVKIKETISKTAVKKHLKAGIQFNTIRMDRRPDTFYVKEIGDE